MLKQLAAIGIGAALILAPVAALADDATPTPAATPMMKKVVHHPVVHHHVVKKPMMVKKPMVKHHVVHHHMAKKPMTKKPMMMKPTPTPTETPKS